MLKKTCVSPYNLQISPISNNIFYNFIIIFFKKEFDELMSTVTKNVDSGKIDCHNFGLYLFLELLLFSDILPKHVVFKHM